jgi:hypothetical protein
MRESRKDKATQIPFPRPSNRRRIALTLCVAVASVASGAFVVFAAAQDSDAAADRLPCTDLKEPVNFSHYSLGTVFDGHEVSAILRRCESPYPGETVRSNYVSFVYGKCEIPTDPETGLAHGGCAPPIEIQTWPACERAHADYTLGGEPYPQKDLGLERGVPATLFDEGSRLELYAGRSTVVIFGNEPADVRAAAEAVRVEPTGEPPAAPLNVAERLVEGLQPATADLPSPVAGAISGDLSC